MRWRTRGLRDLRDRDWGSAMMNGSVSTLAPLFATAALTGRAHATFLVGLAESAGATINMGLAEAL